ncbi:MAG: amino acid permease, partial [Anaerolineales bacterium]|nr:amino acid permease [Anaerolineales bacterium]
MKNNSGHLLRELGLKEALAIGLGTMIGAGIFVLPGIAVERAGQAAAISYLLAGLICLPVAMIISELATGMPHAGGSYTFIAEALGPLAGSVVGPANWLGLTFANGFYLIAAGQYLALFLSIPPWTAALVFGVLFIWLNYRGAKLSGGVQNIVVVILVSILALFVVAGLLNHPAIPRESFPIHGWGPIVGTIGLIIVSFTGFEKISTIAEEVKQPGRTLPLAIIGSVMFATVLYVLLVFVATGLMPPGEIDPQRGLLVEAASLTFGPIGEGILLVAALLATLSSANAATMASSRISYGMGRDLVLPGWFGQAHSKYKTPSNGILFTGGLAVLLAMAGKAETLAEISSALFMVSYALLSISVLVMRRVTPGWYRPTFQAPLYPLLPVMTVILCLGVILTMDRFSQIAGASLVAVSLLWYYVWVRKNAVVAGELGPMLERERPMERIIESVRVNGRGNEHEVLIPVWENEDPTNLLELASALAVTSEEAVINILDMAVVPPQVPLENAQPTLERRHTATMESLSEIIAKTAQKGVPIRTLARAVRSPSSGVAAFVDAHPNIALILTNWKGSLSSSRIYGSPTKNILEKVPCDVAVLLAREFSQVRRIIIPVGGGPHARLGLRLASQFARGEDAELTVLRVLRPYTDLDMDVEMASLKRVVADVLGENASMISPRIVVSNQVSEAILESTRSGEYDLLIIGASEEWKIKSLLAGSLPDAVADQAPCSVLLVRRFEPEGISLTRRILSS